MKKLWLLLSLVVCLPAHAQSNSVYNATVYAYTTQVTQANSATGSSSLLANPTGFVQGIPFLPYNTNASITINRNAATAETITPSALTACYPNSLTCTLSATFTFKHVAGESIQSGTFGLQEAINVAAAAGSGTVLIDASWRGPTGNALITSAHGSTNVLIQDNRNPSGATFYQWNGSVYAASGGGSTFTLNGCTGACNVTGDSTITVSPGGQSIGLHVTAAAGIQSINGDTTSAQAITCTGTGLTCPTTSGTTTITLAGGAGTGSVVSALFGQIGGYASTGTAISGVPNLFSLNPSWSLAQMNGLFSRFGGTLITSYSLTSNVVTAQGYNSFNAGDVVNLQNFGTSTFFNNNYVTISATGLSNTSFQFGFTHANASATESDRPHTTYRSSP